MQRPDSKARRLIEWVASTVRPGGVWSDERVIIFTEYRATQNWLQTLLAAAGLAGQERLLLLYGGMPTDERERIKAAFLADPQDSPVRILLATDAASEGIDLQRHCHQLVHVEIPWNPNRLEQRNGRIDRYGQTHTPLIYHFVGKGYAERSRNPDLAPSELEADLEFLARVVEKVDQMREDLGTVGEVLADSVAAAMLGGRRVLDTAPAERRLDPVRRQLKFERNLREQIDRLSQQLAESRQNLRLAPENYQGRGGCRLAVGRPTNPTAGGGPGPAARRPAPALAVAAALRLLAARPGRAAPPAHPGRAPHYVRQCRGQRARRCGARPSQPPAGADEHAPAARRGVGQHGPARPAPRHDAHRAQPSACDAGRHRPRPPGDRRRRQPAPARGARSRQAARSAKVAFGG